MKRVAIVTLAGCSSRFSKSVGCECHKSLYKEREGDQCLLDWQLSLLRRHDFDSIVLVGGYQFDRLKVEVEDKYADWPITLVMNDHYADWGSCYSLCLGIDAVPGDATSVVFIEGDLLFDDAGFGNLVAVEDNAITATKSIVDARTSVAFYVSGKGKLGYVYDTKHAALCIDEPFVQIGNSGQVWQFADVDRLREAARHCHETQWRGTNLLPILDYYSEVAATSIRVCMFDVWFNCNTINDYKAMKAYVTGVQA